MFHAKVHSTPCHVEENSSEARMGWLLTFCAALTATVFLKELDCISVVWICLRTDWKQQVSRISPVLVKNSSWGLRSLMMSLQEACMGSGSPSPWIIRHGPAGFWSHLQCLHLGGAGRTGRKEKVAWKGMLNSCFPSSLKKNERKSQQASRGIYGKYREVFRNVLTGRLDFW